MIPTSPRFALLGIIFAGFSEYPPSNMTTQQMLTGLNCICETTELKIQDCTMEEFAEATHCVVADPSLMRISASGLSHTNMKVGLFSLFIWRLRALRLRGHTQATFAQVCFSNWY